MNRNRSIIQRMLHESPLTAQARTPMPLIEIMGCTRVLIENHICIDSYNIREISVQVKYGCIFIYGEDLHLTYMSTEKLVITGKLHSIQLNQIN